MRKKIINSLCTLVFSAAGMYGLISCGADEKDDDTSTKDGTKLDWTNDINPVVTKNCGGSGCHQTGMSPGGVVYVDDETAFLSSKSESTRRMALPSSDSSFMPREGTITLEDKNKLLDFLCQ